MWTMINELLMSFVVFIEYKSRIEKKYGSNIAISHRMQAIENHHKCEGFMHINNNYIELSSP